MAPQLRSLLVPFDMTEGSRHALRLADDYARRAGLAVDAVVVGAPGLEDDDRLELHAEVERLECEVRDFLVAPGEDVAEVILEILADRQDTTAWLATHGRSGISALLLGSTAERLVRGADRPVVLVGPHVGLGPAAGPVLVCVAEPESVPTLVGAGERWARLLHAPLRVVHVIEPDDAGTTVAVVEDALARLTTSGLDVDVETVPGDPLEVLDDLATREGAQLVVLGTHARHGLRTALVSLAMSVVHRAPCPVLIEMTAPV